MEEWERKVSHAIAEFSEAKVKENKLLSILENVIVDIDYWGCTELRASLQQIRKSVHEKNEVVLRLLWNAPQSSRSISNFADPGLNLD